MSYSEADFQRDTALVENYRRQREQQALKDAALVQSYRAQNPPPGDREAVAYGAPLQPDRGNMLLATAGEASGIPPAVRTAQRMMGKTVPGDDRVEQPYMDESGVLQKRGGSPAEQDALQVIATLAGTGMLAKAIGPARAVLAQILAAGGAGVGQAALGPEAQELSAKVDDPVGKMLVQAAPSALGTIAGPGAMAAVGTGMGTATRAAGLSRMGVPAGEAVSRSLPNAQVARALLMPAASGSVARMEGKGMFMDPATAQTVRELEALNIPVRPGEAQAMAQAAKGQKASTTPNQRYEYRTATSDAGREFSARQSAGAQSELERRAQSAVKKTIGTSEQMAEDLIASVEKRIADAGTRLEKAETGLLSHKYMKANDKAMGKVFSEAVAELRKDPRLFSKNASVASDDTLRVLKEVEALAKRTKTGNDALLHNHKAVNILEEAFSSVGGLDAATKGRLYGIIREKTVAAMKRNKSLAPLAQEWDRAMSNYADVVFSKGGKSAQSLTGVTPKDVREGVTTPRSAKDVAGATRSGAAAGKVRAAVKAGAASGDDAKAVLLAELRDRSVVGGKFDPATFAKHWKTMPERSKALLPKGTRAALDEFANKVESLGSGVGKQVFENGMASGAFGAALGGKANIGLGAAETIRNIGRTGYYGALRPFHMPRTNPNMGTTAKVAMDASMNTGATLGGVTDQQRRLEEARERARAYMKKNKIKVTGR